MDFFGSPLKTFPLVIIILAAIELIEKMEEINKKYKNMGLWNLTLWRFEGGGGRGGGSQIRIVTLPCFL